MKTKLAYLLVLFTLSIAAVNAEEKAKIAMKTPEALADNTQLLIDKVKADKKLVVANNMALTENEAKGFWPLYDGYQKELGKINERITQTVTSYGEDYTKNTLTDDKAKKLVTEALSIDEAELNLKKSFAEKLSKVLPQTKVARYLQIENKIRIAIKNELAEGIPLVP